MTKDEVVAVIKKHVVECLGTVKAEDIDIEKTMTEYGVNSLDVIEIVSCTMRELKTNIPRQELYNLRTISELADKFLEHGAK